MPVYPNLLSDRWLFSRLNGWSFVRGCFVMPRLALATSGVTRNWSWKEEAKPTQVLTSGQCRRPRLKVGCYTNEKLGTEQELGLAPRPGYPRYESTTSIKPAVVMAQS